MAMSELEMRIFVLNSAIDAEKEREDSSADEINRLLVLRAPLIREQIALGLAPLTLIAGA